MASKRSSSGKRRLLGWPRLPETRPAGPRSSKAAHSRRTCRSDRPTNSPAFACVSRPSTTRRTTSRRSSSLLLIATSSVPIHPTPWRHRAAETGHLYLGGTGHFHFAATWACLVNGVPSPRRRYPSRRERSDSCLRERSDKLPSVTIALGCCVTDSLAEPRAACSERPRKRNSRDMGRGCPSAQRLLQRGHVVLPLRALG